VCDVKRMTQRREVKCDIVRWDRRESVSVGVCVGVHLHHRVLVWLRLPFIYSS